MEVDLVSLNDNCLAPLLERSADEEERAKRRFRRYWVHPILQKRELCWEGMSLVIAYYNLAWLTV